MSLEQMKAERYLELAKKHIMELARTLKKIFIRFVILYTLALLIPFLILPPFIMLIPIFALPLYLMLHLVYRYFRNKLKIIVDLIDRGDYTIALKVLRDMSKSSIFVTSIFTPHLSLARSYLEEAIKLLSSKREKVSSFRQ